MLKVIIKIYVLVFKPKRKRNLFIKMSSNIIAIAAKLFFVALMWWEGDLDIKEKINTTKRNKNTLKLLSSEYLLQKLKK